MVIFCLMYRVVYQAAVMSCRNLRLMLFQSLRSICLSEQIFSNMNHIKNKLRNLVPDESFDSYLKMKVISYKSKAKRLAMQQLQQIKSHSKFLNCNYTIR
jgi:hypothetical protein